MVVTGRNQPPPYRISEVVSRDALLVWVRSMAPDLRIRVQRLDGGRRAATADFTFRGEELNAEAVESPEFPDPDDVIVRRCAWLLRRRLGIHTGLDVSERRQLEREVIDAKVRGDDATADKLALRLVLMNEGVPASRLPVSTRFEPLGGSMFDRHD